jgi:hypothetical protein
MIRLYCADLFSGLLCVLETVRQLEKCPSVLNGSSFPTTDPKFQATLTSDLAAQ